MLIGLSGKFTSGKDTVADYLVGQYGFERRAFADKLKMVCRELFGMRGKERTLLQKFGMVLREIDPDVWVRYVLESVDLRHNIVITDVRYQNEYEAIRQQPESVLFRLECPLNVRIRRYIGLYTLVPTDEQINHPSETDLDSAGFPIILNTDQPIQTTYNSLDRIMDLFDAWRTHKQRD
jgi:hypothetical protein